MRRNVCWLSTLREPVRTLFLLLLVGLISFAFISQAVGHLVVTREMDRLAGYYRAIGSLEMINPNITYSSTDPAYEEVKSTESEPRTYEDHTPEGIALVADSQYVAFEDQRRYCPGVLQGVYNADVDGHSSMSSFSDIRISDVLVYGKLSSKCFAPSASDRPDEYHLMVNVDQVEAGYPEYVQEGSNIRLRWLVEDPSEAVALYDSLQVGKRYFFRAYYNYRLDATLNKKVAWEGAPNNLVLKPLNDRGLWFQPMEPGVGADFSNPALAELVEELRATEENRHTMWVMSTKDMSAIPIVQAVFKQYYLTNGRWLNREDDIKGNRVCAVSHDFAQLRGLTVGDTITLKFRVQPRSYFPYVEPRPDGRWDAWQDYETHTEEFEIVCIYGRFPTRSVYSINDINCIYVPNSCMPPQYGDSTKGGTTAYSFILRSPEDGDAFLSENREALAELGLRATLVDTGWEKFYAAVVPMRQAAATGTVIFTLVLVLAMALVAFLYLRQRQRDFAILRSLGVPERIAIRQTLQPIARVGGSGVLLGGAAGWAYALVKAISTLASFHGVQGIGASALLSFIWFVILCILSFALLMAFVHAGLSVIARRPVLELLQGVARQAGGRRQVNAGLMLEHAEEASHVLQPPFAAQTPSVSETPGSSSPPGFPQAARYVLRHIRRAPLKSILTVTVALCFTFALGWMNWTIELNEAELDQLYRATQVEAEIMKGDASRIAYGGYIGHRVVDEIMASGFVQESYVEGAALVPSVAATTDGVEDADRTIRDILLRSFDQPKQFFAKKGTNAIVRYADGWDETLFSQDWSKEELKPVLLPVYSLPRLRLRSGDHVSINSSNGRVTGDFVVAGYYAGTIEGDGIAPILLPTSALQQLEKDQLQYAVAEFVFDPARNRELPEFRARMDTLFVGNELTLLFWDEELTEVVEPLEKNLSLMTLLYTVTVIVSVLIAAGLATLLLFQSAREAAIMRVLGTTKSRARAMLCGQHLLLCLVGLVVGLSILVALRQDVVAVLQGPALVCAGLYFAGASGGALYSAIAVTNRMPLELLQVKE